ncbi:MAG: hypothetical protein M1817_004951 [Caeruleum heppii]|nr:MAG: hypothetical protein M1817_004951 [Caeruleum heppii]
MQLSRAARIILVGAPGVGKGTQTDRLIQRYPQLSSISSGDLLRDNVRNKTPLGIKAEATMAAGALVPDAMILRLILNELRMRNWISPPEEPMTLSATAMDAAIPPVDDFITSHGPTEIIHQTSDDPSASFVLDGFPRTVPQALQLDAQISINLVVHLITPTSRILDRICNRLVHAPSGRVYNTTFNPPQVAGRDDVTGEPLTRRADDDPDTWLSRLKKFDETSRPLLEHYDGKGVLWTVNGDSSDEISPKLFEEFERRFA